jgi:hypothetical protein
VRAPSGSIVVRGINREKTREKAPTQDVKSRRPANYSPETDLSLAASERIEVALT